VELSKIGKVKDVKNAFATQRIKLAKTGHKTEMNDFHGSVISIIDGVYITGEHSTLNCLLSVLRKEVIS
jgi:hypothetical protein